MYLSKKCPFFIFSNVHLRLQVFGASSLFLSRGLRGCVWGCFSNRCFRSSSGWGSLGSSLGRSSLRCGLLGGFLRPRSGSNRSNWTTSGRPARCLILHCQPLTLQGVKKIFKLGERRSRVWCVSLHICKFCSVQWKLDLPHEFIMINNETAKNWTAINCAPGSERSFERKLVVPLKRFSGWARHWLFWVGVHLVCHHRYRPETF